MSDTQGDGKLMERKREREEEGRESPPWLSPPHKQTAGREFTTKKRKRERGRENESERALPFLLFRGPAMFDQIDCEAAAVRVN